MININACTSLPVIANVDLAVIEGGLSGLSAALKAAEMGKKVLLLEPRTFLGYELNYTKPFVTRVEKYSKCLKYPQGSLV